MAWVKYTWLENITKAVAARFNNEEEGIEEDKTAAAAALALAATKVTKGEAETIAGEAVKKTELPAATAVATGNITALTGIPAKGETDEVTLAEGNIVLCPNQTVASQRGPWEIPAGAGAWVRPTGFAHGSEQLGAFIGISSGALYAGSIWVMTNLTKVTVDTTGQTWTTNSAGAGISTGLPLTYEGFGFGLLAGTYTSPPVDWRPYSTESPLNSLGAARIASVLKESAVFITKLLTYNGGHGKPELIAIGSTGTNEEFNHPVYYPKSTDPTYVIKQSGTEPPLPDVVRLPAGAKAEQGSDKHLCIIMPNGDEFDCWATSSITAGTPGTITCINASKSSIRDKGVKVGAATASGFSLMAGIIRIAEWKAAIEGPVGTGINHALFALLPEAMGSTRYYKEGLSAEALSRLFKGGASWGAYPGQGGGRLGTSKTSVTMAKTTTLKAISEPFVKRLGIGTSVSGTGIAGGTTVTAILSPTEVELSQAATKTETVEVTFEGFADVLPMGGWLRLNYSDAEIAALGLAKWEEVIALTLARYGAFLGDTSGAQALMFMVESRLTYTTQGVTDPGLLLGQELVAKGAPRWEHYVGGLFNSYLTKFTSEGGAGKINWEKLQVLQPPSLL